MYNVGHTQPHTYVKLTNRFIPHIFVYCRSQGTLKHYVEGKC